MLYETLEGMTIREMATNEVRKYFELSCCDPKLKQNAIRQAIEIIKKRDLREGFNFSIYYKGEMVGRIELKSDDASTGTLSIWILNLRNWNEKLNTLVLRNFLTLQEKHHMVDVLKIPYTEGETHLRKWYEYEWQNGKLFLRQGSISMKYGDLTLSTANNGDISKYLESIEENQEELEEWKNDCGKEVQKYAIYYDSNIMGMIKLKKDTNGYLAKVSRLEIINSELNEWAEYVQDALITMCKEHRICSILQMPYYDVEEERKFWETYDVSQYVVPEDRQFKTA
jgi:hypothetical protein